MGDDMALLSSAATAAGGVMVQNDSGIRSITSIVAPSLERNPDGEDVWLVYDVTWLPAGLTDNRRRAGVTR